LSHTFAVLSSRLKAELFSTAYSKLSWYMTLKQSQISCHSSSKQKSTKSSCQLSYCSKAGYYQTHKLLVTSTLAAAGKSILPGAGGGVAPGGPGAGGLAAAGGAGGQPGGIGPGGIPGIGIIGTTLLTQHNIYYYYYYYHYYYIGAGTFAAAGGANGQPGSIGPEACLALASSEQLPLS